MISFAAIVCKNYKNTFYNFYYNRNPWIILSSNALKNNALLTFPYFFFSKNVSRKFNLTDHFDLEFWKNRFFLNIFWLLSLKNDLLKYFLEILILNRSRVSFLWARALAFSVIGRCSNEFFSNSSFFTLWTVNLRIHSFDHYQFLDISLFMYWPQ